MGLRFKKIISTSQLFARAVESVARRLPVLHGTFIIYTVQFMYWFLFEVSWLLQDKLHYLICFEHIGSLSAVASCPVFLRFPC